MQTTDGSLQSLIPIDFMIACTYYMCVYLSYIGEGDEKGKVTGIFRSLGALARALGPSVACGSKSVN